MQCLCTEDSPDGMTMYPRSPCIVGATVVCLALCITATPVVVILRAHAINEFRICMGQSRVRRYWITYVNERTNLGSGGEYPKNPTVYPTGMPRPDGDCRRRAPHPHREMSWMWLPLQRRPKRSQTSRERGRHRTLIDRGPGLGGRLLGPRARCAIVRRLL
jgi:hypothetical protein